MKKYNPKTIEKKWQKYWEEHQTFQTPENPKNKQYILDMFPYPSGAGLHVGHPEGYTATDIIVRYKRMNGFDVLHPMGWDAFGLPAENYAIKEGVAPAITTQKNIDRFRKQIKAIGLSYDWSREVNTSEPEYYKWTQWLFLLFYKNGLAYKKEAYVNWCPKDNTVLANEQVVNGHCDRCGTQVEQRLLSQWFFNITKYAEELLSGLDTVDWPEPIKTMQRNWIGKSEGAEIDFSIVIPAKAGIHSESGSGSRIKSGMTENIKVFTTRPDTIFGATYLVLAPEHTLVENSKDQIQNWEEVDAYREATKKKVELERTALAKDKSGVELKGLTAVNPATKESIPVWIADYVLASYGTGAIMAVPAHDERDFEFATKFGLPISPVINPGVISGDAPDASIRLTNILSGTECYIGFGRVINSGKFDGLSSEEAILKMAEEFGTQTIKYKLRDWLVSRQRYWGAPIPIIYCETDGMQPVPEGQLPVILPTDVDFKPTGESPLASSKTFHVVNCPKCGKPATRDSDTMDTFVDSSWYFFRFADPHNEQEFASKKQLETWLPVDMYLGGAEHAVLHLLYARFFCKALRDLGYVSFNEPFLKLRNQGLILGPDGNKMSKSKGNVINPDDVIEAHGADSLRMYEMFMGPLEDSKPWNTNGLVGLYRFLDRIWVWANQIIKNKDQHISDSALAQKHLHKLIKKVTGDIESLSFNTAIASMMEFHNAVKDEPVSLESLKIFLKLLYPFAPHIVEELHELSGGTQTMQGESWPTFDPALIVESEVNIIIQVNGKVRDRIVLPSGSAEAAVRDAALQSDKIKTALGGAAVKRVVYVVDKLLNIVL